MLLELRYNTEGRLSVLFLLLQFRLDAFVLVGVFGVPGTLARDGELVRCFPAHSSWSDSYLFGHRFALCQASFRHVPCEPAEITQRFT